MIGGGANEGFGLVCCYGISFALIDGNAGKGDLHHVDVTWTLRVDLHFGPIGAVHQGHSPQRCDVEAHFKCIAVPV